MDQILLSSFMHAALNFLFFFFTLKCDNRFILYTLSRAGARDTFKHDRANRFRTHLSRCDSKCKCARLSKPCSTFNPSWRSWSARSSVATVLCRNELLELNCNTGSCLKSVTTWFAHDAQHDSQVWMPVCSKRLRYNPNTTHTKWGQREAGD